MAIRKSTLREIVYEAVTDVADELTDDEMSEIADKAATKLMEELGGRVDDDEDEEE